MDLTDIFLQFLIKLISLIMDPNFSFSFYLNHEYMRKLVNLYFNKVIDF